MATRTVKYLAPTSTSTRIRSGPPTASTSCSSDGRARRSVSSRSRAVAASDCRPVRRPAARAPARRGRAGGAAARGGGGARRRDSRRGAGRRQPNAAAQQVPGLDRSATFKGGYTISLWTRRRRDRRRRAKSGIRDPGDRSSRHLPTSARPAITSSSRSARRGGGRGGRGGGRGRARRPRAVDEWDRYYSLDLTRRTRSRCC